MGASVLGALRVILGADTSDLDKGLAGAKSSFTSFTKQISVIAGGITLEKGIEKAVESIVHAVKQGVEEADKLNKLSQSIGVPVDELSKLKYAADLSDVSLESLGKSVGKLSKAMVEVAGGGTGPAKQAFDALGVSVTNTDGTLKSSSEVLSEIAGKFEGYKDGAAKTALAIAIFGKAGADMIPLLNQGAEGLKTAGDEAEKFGIVLDKKTSQAAEDFNDNLTRMGKIKDGIILQITARLLPAFEQFSERMVEAAKDGDLLTKTANGIVFAFRSVESVVLTISSAIKPLIGELSAVWQILNAGNFTELKDGLAAFSKAEQQTQATSDALAVSIAKIWSDTPVFDWNSEISGVRTMSKEVNLLGGEWGKTAAPIIASSNATKNAVEQYLAGQAKRIASQTAEAATVGKSAAEQAKLRVELEAQALAKEKNIPLTDALNARIAATGAAAANAAMVLQAANLTQQVMSPADVFAQKMDQQRQLYEAGKISLETYGKAQQMVAEQAGATWDIAGASIAGSFATISSAFGKESSSMATAAKVFGIIQGTISMFTGAAKALELPFPANIAAVAAVLAKGASLVASIKGQTVPSGMMTGGSMTVRGGGGPDSTPVSFMASPGEQIDVWRPDQGGGADPRGGGANGGKSVVLNGFAWGRDQMTQLFEFLNEGMRDGHKLDLKFA